MGRTDDLISRQEVMRLINNMTVFHPDTDKSWKDGYNTGRAELYDMITVLPSALGADNNVGSKYEYHYDHTDCIWYRPEARNRCPVTCAQYRDGWNDAMNYIFRDGKGYRPYRRGEKYEAD